MLSIRDLNLSARQQASLNRAALNGDYHLLLGAGASLDAKSTNGRLLPKASDLQDELVDEFSVAKETGDPLWRTYDRAVTKVGATAVYAYLRTRFQSVKPPPWLLQVAAFPWSTVWTLNLDDAFEAAYRQIASAGSRRIRSVTWDDEYHAGSDLNVVHLHGHVISAAPKPLVFSLSEYADASVQRAAWPATFRDIYGVSPFIIVGARLQDEPDIERVISRRKLAADAPTIYVNPYMSDAVADDMRNWGMIPVRATAEETLPLLGEMSGRDLTKAPVAREEFAFRLGRQFIDLRTDRRDKNPVAHDFYGGDEPTWSDILDDLPADLDWIRAGESVIARQSAASEKSSALIFTGDRLTGRSAGLLYLARQFRRLNWRVFLFAADERPDTDAILQFASDGKPIVLVFDGIADIAEDLATVIDRARAAGLALQILAVDVTDRSTAILGRIPRNFIAQDRIVEVNRRLSRSDAAHVVDRLQLAGRLGMLEKVREDGKRLQHFSGHELFPALAELEDAPGFGRRVHEQVKLLPSGRDVELVFFASMAARVGRRLHSIDAARMIGIESDQLLNLARSEDLRVLIQATGKSVVARQRWLALKATIDRLGESQAVALLGRGVIALTGRLGRESQRERNGTSLLVGSLMTYRTLSETFPGYNLEDFYAVLVPAFGDWSGRFWEQRAIMSRHRAHEDPAALARAESFARRAISLREDTYSYTTLGTILAARGAIADAPLMAKYYDEVYDAFEGASRHDPKNLVTWVAFLRHSLPVLDRALHFQSEEAAEVADRLREDWQRVHAGLVASLGASENSKSEIDALEVRFDRLTRVR